MRVVEFDAGGYRFVHVQGVFQFSSGVLADRGYEVERVRLPAPVPLADGFRLVEKRLAAVGRPIAALCAMELRSPAPFSERGFVDFNRRYVGQLAEWGLVRDYVNPVARTNVCPVRGAPAVPSLHSFAYTARSTRRSPTFVLAGSSEADQGPAEYRDSIVRRGDVSTDGMREKLACILTEQEKRLRILGLGWADVGCARLYTAHDLGPLIRECLFRTGTAAEVTWIDARPPVQDLDLEMDNSSVAREVVLDGEA
ncbi:2-amino-5-chloromuconate deaminase CnbZ [Pseudonocardia sp. TRM90224]|uniref:2-amino-5-chloromuconate deaminase CnbZ n=1 Tax=Pseudonocardia sp. TRM90224 TaxID=2812678 RepID=UPI001E4815C5|nr:hypothetical protein [Pseudonocardia sp. TRM90224]